MLIIAYFDEAQYASNAITHLKNNPAVTDVSYISFAQIDEQIQTGRPAIRQGEVSISPLSLDTFYASLSPGDQQMGQFVFSDYIGTVLVGGQLLDQFQIAFPDMDTAPYSLSFALSKLGLGEYSNKIISHLNSKNYILFVSIKDAKTDPVNRLLQNHNLLDSDLIDLALFDTRS